MEIGAVMQAAATLVAAKITTREARNSEPFTQDELVKELVRARDAVWAALKVPSPPSKP